MFLIGMPLLLIPFAIYNIVEFLLPGASPGEANFGPKRCLSCR